MLREQESALAGGPDVDSGDGADIAIIGMAGRFPGADGIERFWANLLAGEESISFFSEAELAGVEPRLRKHPRFVPARGIVDDIEDFDAGFFGLGAREAEVMDPQQRVFLECAWEALEHAGHAASAGRGRVGVYASAYLSTYLLRNLYPNRHALRDLGAALLHQGNVSDQLATRVSYKLDLTGPSITVQTACSSSLVAVHLACQGLLTEECDLALAGGVSLVVPQRGGYLYEPGGIMSPDGHCRPFDARAQGTVFSDGAGLVVLKRLADALAQGDTIHAVIKGSAINNDGGQRIGYTAPSIDGQAEVIRNALAMAGLHPDDIGYVEAHGTGTELGDPIEVHALTQVFQEDSARTHKCVLGSVKSNIGHLDNAAGVVGLIKAALVVEHGQIPGTLHFEEANPRADLAHSPFEVSAAPMRWPGSEREDGQPRRAGVSAFGVGGTNAHVIVEQAPAARPAPGRPAPASRSHELLLISARSEAALDAVQERLIAHLQQHPALSLADAAHTLAVGRPAFAHRRMLVCRDLGAAAAALQSPAPSRAVMSAHHEGAPADVVFLFPGQGAQHPGMASALYRSEPVFRAEVDRCAELLRPHLDVDLHAVLRAVLAAERQDAALLQRTELAQPALFVVEYALARLLMHWGITPKAMLGHSLGEYVAACLAGVLSLPAALALVAARGRMVQGLPGGAMLAVPLSEAELVPLLGQRLSLAASNASQLTVASGPEDDIVRLEQELLARGLRPRRLVTSHALHSAMMEPILAAFERAVRAHALAAPTIPFVSSVTGTWIRPEEATDPAYWARHLRQPVRFARAVDTLAGPAGALQRPVLLEVGPGTTLTTLVKHHAPGLRAVSSLPHPHELTKQPDAAGERLLAAVGQLWLAGATVDWQAFYAGQARRRIPLPTYPFERRRLWIDAPEDEAGSITVRQSDVADWFQVASWRQAPPVQVRTLREDKRTWLVFGDDGPLSRAVAEQLERGGQLVTMVNMGERFERVGRDGFTIHPGQRDDYDALVRELRALAKTPSAILHLWNVGPAGDHAMERSFYSLLFLGQALAAQGSHQPVDLTVISTGVHDVTGDEILEPEKALLLGPCRVLPQENPQLACRAIDVTAPETEAAARELAQRLLAEILAGTSAPRLALRGAQTGRTWRTWLESYEPMRLDAEVDTLPGLEPHGVYLITGGLGGIGLALAEALARTCQARLVLIGRTPLPAREDWQSWIATHGPAEPTSRLLQRLLAMEAQQAEVLVLAADVADEAAMRAAVARARERFATIDGVIHAAGVAGGGMIEGRTRAAADQVFAAKVHGTRVLAAALADLPLAFFALCSSTAAVLGGLGQVDYCAANAFLDAFARERHRAGVRMLSIGWDTWRDVGMAATADVPEALRPLHEERMRDGIESTEGARAFVRALRSPVAHVVVSPVPLTARLPRFQGSALLEHVKRLDAARRPRAGAGRSREFVAPATDVERRVAEVFEQLLGVERIGSHDDFFELGGHSLLASQATARLRDIFGVDLPVLALFEGRTVEQVALAIEELVLEEIEGM